MSLASRSTAGIGPPRKSLALPSEMNNHGRDPKSVRATQALEHLGNIDRHYRSRMDQALPSQQEAILNRWAAERERWRVRTVYDTQAVLIDRLMEHRRLQALALKRVA